MNSTLYSERLLSTFSSPGTRATFTRTVTAVSSGGCSSSGSSAEALWPVASCGIVSDVVIGSSPSRRIRSVTLMSNSSFSPWFVKLTVKPVPGSYVRRLLTPGSSVVSP